MTGPAARLVAGALALASAGCAARPARAAPTLASAARAADGGVGAALPVDGGPIAGQAPPSAAGPIAGPALPSAAGGPAAGDADMASAALAWARREDPATLEEAIRLWERAAGQLQDPVPALVGAARAHRLRADQLSAAASVAAADAEPGATSAELLAASARESALCAAEARKAWTTASPAAAAALNASDPSGAFAQVSAALAPALYLDAACAAAWARAQGFTQLIEKRAELQGELSRAATLDPDLDAAGPDRELGKLFAALPASAGGDAAEARRRFEAALARAPWSITTRVSFAGSVAIKEQSRTLFEALLDRAESTPARDPEDRAAQAQGRALRSRADELFGPGSK